MRFLIAAITKKYVEPHAKQHAKYCFVICAKNEQDVITRAINSIRAQNYPQNLYDILVVDDNSNDKTVEVCKQLGATNILHKKDNLIGKGHALDFAFKHLLNQQNIAEVPNQTNQLTTNIIDYDAVIVLDADNVINKDFLSHMNNSFINGQEVIAPFRNTKSFSQSIMAAANALWFLRDAVMNNRGHFLINNQCTVSGTGFLISKKIIQKLNGFPFNTMIEDFEFSAYACYKNIKISYNNNATVYDFAAGSAANFDKQHTRWLSGFVDVIVKTISNIIKGITKSGTRKYCIDYSMRIFVIALIIIAEIFMIIFSVIASIAMPGFAASIWLNELLLVLLSLAILVFILYVFLIITVVDNWNKINAPTHKKITSIICYPFSQLFNIPLFFKSLFSKRKWSHIER